ncbi:hypothetical protein KML24003_25750 [Alistipes finegoldii]
MFVVALVMFPLNFLWVGQSPLHAAVSSLLFGLPALLSAWTPKERRTGRRNESRGTAVCAQSRRCAGAGIHAAPAGRIDSAANAGAAMPAGVARCSESAGRAGAERFGESAAHPESCGRTASADGTEPARRKSLLSKAALGIAFCVLAAMLAYDIVTEGVAVGVTKSVGFVLLILVAALGSRLGYLKF